MSYWQYIPVKKKTAPSHDGVVLSNELLQKHHLPRRRVGSGVQTVEVHTGHESRGVPLDDVLTDVLRTVDEGHEVSARDVDEVEEQILELAVSGTPALLPAFPDIQDDRDIPLSRKAAEEIRYSTRSPFRSTRAG